MKYKGSRKEQLILITHSFIWVSLADLTQQEILRQGACGTLGKRGWRTGRKQGRSARQLRHSDGCSWMGATRPRGGGSKAGLRDSLDTVMAAAGRWLRDPEGRSPILCPQWLRVHYCPSLFGPCILGGKRGCWQSQKPERNRGAGKFTHWTTWPHLSIWPQTWRRCLTARLGLGPD